MNPIINSKNLQITFGNGRGVKFDDISLCPGDFLLVQGPNGAGKTSFLSLFTLPRSFLSYFGELYLHLDGRDIDILSTLNQEETAYYRTRVAYLEQERASFYSDSVYDVLSRTCLSKLKAMPKPFNVDAKTWKNVQKERKKRLKIWIKEIWKRLTTPDEHGLNSPILDGITAPLRGPRFVSFSALSGGQKKMVRFYSVYLQAKILGSSVLVLDEPLNDLDRENKKRLSNLLKELLDAPNPPVAICITHCHIFPYRKMKKLTIEEAFDGLGYRHANFDQSLTGDKDFHPCLGEYKDEIYLSEKEDLS